MFQGELSRYEEICKQAYQNATDVKQNLYDWLDSPWKGFFTKVHVHVYMYLT